MNLHQSDSPNSDTKLSPQRVTASCLFVISVILVGVALAYTRKMMIPFAFSVFFALVLAPIVNFLQVRFRIPRVVVVSLCLITVMLIIGFIMYLLGNTIAQTLAGLDIYYARVQRAIDYTVSLANQFGAQIDGGHVRKFIMDLPFLTYLQNVTGEIANLFSNTLIINVFLFFILTGQRPMPLDVPVRQGLSWKIDRLIRRYLLVKAATSTLTGALVWLTLALLGVDLALMFGFLTFILNFIPTIGSIVATLLPIPIVLLQFDSVVPILLAIGIPTLIQFSIGTVTEPKILGDSLDMHPVAILMSLMFWGIIWGPVGMFLAVPITIAVKLLLERFSETRMIAQAMSGKSPLLE